MDSLDKIERHRLKPQLKLYFNTNTNLKVLFPSVQARTTFTELLHLLHENCWITDDGEFVDACDSNYICYNVNKEKRVLCIHVLSGKMYLVEQNMYFSYSGKEGMKYKMNNERKKGKSSVGLDRMEQVKLNQSYIQSEAAEQNCSFDNYCSNSFFSILTAFKQSKSCNQATAVM